MPPLPFCCGTLAEAYKKDMIAANPADKITCGREHYASLKKVSIKKGALNDLPLFAKELGFRKLYLISDPVTYEIAGRDCMAILQKARIEAKMCVLHHTALLAIMLSFLVTRRSHLTAKIN